MVGGAPVALRYKERWRPPAHSTRFVMRRQTHRKTLARSEGAQKQRKAAASAPHQTSSSTPLASPPPSSPSSSTRRRWRRRPRQRRCDREAAASLAAALEQIFLSEPEMAAGSSSSAGGDGLSLPPSVYSSIPFVLDLGPLCTHEKKREREYPLDPCTSRS